MNLDAQSPGIRSDETRRMPAFTMTDQEIVFADKVICVFSIVLESIDPIWLMSLSKSFSGLSVIAFGVTARSGSTITAALGRNQRAGCRGFTLH
jgi:hypothetical protein